jgi:hypothetical protein
MRDGKCDCSATGPDECVCGAWDNATRTEREITLAHHGACTCGGAGPGEGCPACNMWHILYPANAHADHERASRDTVGRVVGSSVGGDK